MRWWTSRGPRESFKGDEQGQLLLEVATHWGGQVLHLFDQGLASSFWLGLLLAFSLRFVLRWKKEYQGVDAQGKRRAAWKSAQGKGGWQERTVWDCRRHRWVQASILALPVRHPDHREQPLWLVIARRKGGLPCSLLTNEPITCAQDAWGIMFADARRWHIELTWRENKSELAFQSPRLWHWEPREKLLLLARLAYAFLLTLLEPFYELLRRWLLRRSSHRTGRHCRQAHAPVARLRLALSQLWQSFPVFFRTASPFSACCITSFSFFSDFPFHSNSLSLCNPAAFTTFLSFSGDDRSMHFSAQGQEMHASIISPSLKSGMTHVFPVIAWMCDSGR
jgi:hypothetical protein